MNLFLKTVLLALASGAGLYTPAALADTGGATADSLAHGRYLVQVGGCNDCHTPGYLMNDGNTPESQWLIGDTFGWHGPWGTTYPPNLRLFLKDMSEDDWVTTAHTMKRRPPMPWYTLNRMTDADLRDIYRYIRSLGDPGVPAPAYLPPDQQPPMPYAEFPSPPPPKP